MKKQHSIRRDGFSTVNANSSNGLAQNLPIEEEKQVPRNVPPQADKANDRLMKSNEQPLDSIDEVSNENEALSHSGSSNPRRNRSQVHVNNLDSFDRGSE